MAAPTLPPVSETTTRPRLRFESGVRPFATFGASFSMNQAHDMLNERVSDLDALLTLMMDNIEEQKPEIAGRQVYLAARLARELNQLHQVVHGLVSIEALKGARDE